MSLVSQGVTAPQEPISIDQWILERGISGTTNWFGDPLSEQNTALIHSAGYGLAGTRTWGEWQKIALTDPDVATVLEFITAPIRDAMIGVVQSDAPGLDPALAKTHADFVRSQLADMEPGSSEVLSQMVGGSLSAGFSMHEVVLRAGAHPMLPGGQGYLMSKLAERMPVSVHPINGWREKVLLDGSRELDYIQQMGQTTLTGFSATIKLPAEKVLLCSWRRHGNNYRGISAFRAVWYIAKIREQLLKLVGIALVREGAGIPVASSASDAQILSPSQQKKLARALQNLVGHENASIVMPKGWKIDWIFSPGANKGHIMEVYNGLGMLILRQLGAQQISIGTGYTGSRAAGQTHNDVAQGYIQGVVSALEGTLNGIGARPYCGLARKLIDPNWGPQPGYPRISLTLKRASLAPVDRVQAMAQGAQAGLLTITARDEINLRDELGMERLEESEIEQARAAKAAMAPAPQSPQATPGLAAPALSRLSRDGSFTPWRALRPAEQKMELGRIDRFLTDQRDEFQRIIRPLVMEMLAKAAPGITAALKDHDPSEVAAIPLDTKRIEKAIEAWLGSLRAQGKRDVTRELVSDVDPTKDRGVVKMAAAPEMTPDPRDKVVSSQGKALVRRVVGRVRAWVEDEAIDALRTGGDAESVVADVVSSQMQTNAFRQDAGTAITAIYNIGRDEAAEYMGASNAEYSAILDGNTCSSCSGKDGKTFDLDSDEYEENLPPNRDCDGGANCRCLMAYIAGSAQ